MKKKVIILLSSIFLCLIISAVKVNASTPISPISEVYKEGIYQLNKEDTGSYNLQYQFLNKDKDSAIIILDENDDIVEFTKKAFANLNIQGKTASTGGGSDTNVLNKNGIKAVNLGIGMKKAHTLEEYIAIEDLINSAKTVIEIIKEA